MNKCYVICSLSVTYHRFVTVIDTVGLYWFIAASWLGLIVLSWFLPPNSPPPAVYVLGVLHKNQGVITPWEIWINPRTKSTLCNARISHCEKKMAPLHVRLGRRQNNGRLLWTTTSDRCAQFITLSQSTTPAARRQISTVAVGLQQGWQHLRCDNNRA